MQRRRQMAKKTDTQWSKKSSRLTFFTDNGKCQFQLFRNSSTFPFIWTLLIFNEKSQPRAFFAPLCGRRGTRWGFARVHKGVQPPKLPHPQLRKILSLSQDDPQLLKKSIPNFTWLTSLFLGEVDYSYNCRSGKVPTPPTPLPSRPCHPQPLP